MYAGLEMGGIASSNVNYFWGNCELFLQSESPNVLGTANCRLRIIFEMDSSKDLFFGPHSFFRQILCISCKNANKMRIMIRNYESLYQSDSQLRSE